MKVYKIKCVQNIIINVIFLFIIKLRCSEWLSCLSIRLIILGTSVRVFLIVNSNLVTK